MRAKWKVVVNDGRVGGEDVERGGDGAVVSDIHQSPDIVATS